MDWKEYEQVTKQIYETLGKDAGVIIECFGGSCKVKGKSGVEHQIDVLTSHSDGIHIYKTAIECKYWDKTINKDIVMKVSEIIGDAGINKGVIVSKKGFTEDGILFAKFKNIGLVELREIEDKDWEGRIENIVIQINMLLPRITEFQVIVSEPHPDFDVRQGPIDAFEIIYPDSSSEVVEMYIKEFYSELCKKDEGEILEKVIRLKPNSKLNYKPSNKAISIQGFKLTGVLHIGKRRTEIKGKDHIWLIMKSVFENKRYTISKDGDIQESV